MAIAEKTDKVTEAQRAMTSLQLADVDVKKRKEQRKRGQRKKKLQADALIQPGWYWFIPLALGPRVAAILGPPTQKFIPALS